VGGVLTLVGGSASRLLPESRKVICSLPEPDFHFSVFLFLFVSTGCFRFFTGGIAVVVSFSTVFPLAQLANRATERMERIARMAMDPVVVLGGARREGSYISSGIGQDTFGR